MRLYLALALCATSVNAQDIVEYNGFSVAIEGQLEKVEDGKPVPDDYSISLANRVCGYTEKRALFASSSPMDDEHARFFFVCM